MKKTWNNLLKNKKNFVLYRSLCMKRRRMLSVLVLPFVSFGLPRGVCAVLTVLFFGIFLVLYLLGNVGF